MDKYCSWSYPWRSGQFNR